MKVVILGGSGHVGTYLVPRLVMAGHLQPQFVRAGGQDEVAEARRLPLPAEPPDPAVPQPRRIQPRFVEFKAGWEQIRDALVKARHEQASDAGFNHAQEFLITSESVQRSDFTRDYA